MPIGSRRGRSRGRVGRAGACVAVAVLTAGLWPSAGPLGPASAAADDAAAAAGGGAAPAKPKIRRGVPGLFLTDADGSNPRPLVKVQGVRWCGSPSWSHDGNSVTFDAIPAGQAGSEVYVYAAGGPEKGALKNLGPGYCPVYSPDGGTLAFHLDADSRGVGEPGVWLMKPDGTARRRVCDGDHPRWSPDGKRLLVTHETATPATIDEVVVETGKATRLLASKYARIPGATYSPDGRRVAFVGYEQADLPLTQADLVVMTLPAAGIGGGGEAGGGGADAAAGGGAAVAGPLTVLQHGRFGWTPTWSPDGKQLAYFAWDRVDGTDYDTINLIAADGKSPPAKLKGQDGQGTRSAEAEWSPDGKTLVFGSDRGFPADKQVDRPDPPATGL